MGEEKKEKELRIHISDLMYERYQLKKNLKETQDKLEIKKIEKQLKQNSKKIEYLSQYKLILDEINSISKKLEDKSLTEEERKNFIQRRDNLHVQKKELNFEEFEKNIFIIMEKDEMVEKELRMRRELFIPISGFMYERYQLKKNLKETQDELEFKKIEKQLKQNSKKIEYFHQYKLILDEINSISKKLEDKSLTEEERKYFIQRRYNLRVQKKEHIIREIERSVDFYKKNPELISKRKRRPPGGILGDPGFIRCCVICSVLFFIIGMILIFIIMG